MTLERPILAIAALVIFPLAIMLAKKLGSPFTASVPLGPLAALLLRLRII